MVETWEYYPYGEQWIHQGGVGNKHRYTGHLRDAESENDYAGARYYTNTWGRWLSVDPELGDIYNPQRLNRYSYVLNDPVNYVDPDGRFEIRISSLLHYYTYVEMRERQIGPPSGGSNHGGRIKVSRARQEKYTLTRFRYFLTEQIHPQCQGFFGPERMAEMAQRTGESGDVQLWRLQDHLDTEILSLPGVTGTFDVRTIGEYFGSSSSVRATVLRNNENETFPHVIYSGSQLSPREMLHEVGVHIVMGFNDVDFYNRYRSKYSLHSYINLDDYQFPDTGAATSWASRAISAFFNNNCGKGPQQ